MNMKWAFAVVVLALPAQIGPAFAESAIEAAYALVQNGGDYEPIPRSGWYFEKEPMECKNGKNGCFFEKTFKRIDDCRYFIDYYYYETDPEHPGRGRGWYVIYDFGKARKLVFRRVSNHVISGYSSLVPGVVFDGEDGFFCGGFYKARTADRRALDGTMCKANREIMVVERRAGKPIVKLPNRARFQSHWAALREYCPGPTGD
jgi:hypothetical protein